MSRHVNRESGEGYGGVIGIAYSVYTQKRMLKLHIMINKSIVSCAVSSWIFERVSAYSLVRLTIGPILPVSPVRPGSPRNPIGP